MGDLYAGKIEKYLGIEPAMSFNEIGERIGISRQLAQLIFYIAVGKLAAWSGNHELHALVPPSIVPLLPRTARTVRRRKSATWEW